MEDGQCSMTTAMQAPQVEWDWTNVEKDGLGWSASGRMLVQGDAGWTEEGQLSMWGMCYTCAVALRAAGAFPSDSESLNVTLL